MEKTLNLNGINFNTGIKNIMNSAFHSFLYSFSPKKTYYRLKNLEELQRFYKMKPFLVPKYFI
jgi:hypothetical protein